MPRDHNATYLHSFQFPDNTKLDWIENEIPKSNLRKGIVISTMKIIFHLHIVLLVMWPSFTDGSSICQCQFKQLPQEYLNISTCCKAKWQINNKMPPSEWQNWINHLIRELEWQRRKQMIITIVITWKWYLYIQQHTGNDAKP